jgi:hypothetical protein
VRHAARNGGPVRMTTPSVLRVRAAVTVIVAIIITI